MSSKPRNIPFFEGIIVTSDNFLMHVNTNSYIEYSIYILGYYEKDEEFFYILEKVFELLTQNGFFVLDYFNRNFVIKNIVAKTVEEIDDSTITQNRFIEGDRIVKEITIDRKGRVNKFFESVRMFSSDELINMIQKLGFNNVKTFGDFRGNPFELESSPRIIIIVNK